MTTAPFELLVGPIEIYTGPVNEARPDLEDAPAGNWTLLGTSGSKNYGEDGVVITPEDTISEFFVLGSTAPQKAHRSQERWTCAVTLHDLTVEHLATAMNGASITEAAPGSGTAGVRDIDLLRGADVTEIGLLLRSAAAARDYSAKDEGYRTGHPCAQPGQVAQPTGPQHFASTGRGENNYSPGAKCHCGRRRHDSPLGA